MYEAMTKLKIGGQCSFHQLQGKQSFGRRVEEFEEFSQKRDSAVLICTDVAARGMDIPRVDWVIQMDYPECFDDYIHRIGRTARFNNAGNSLIFVMPEEVEKFKSDLGRKKISATNVAANNKKVFSVSNRLRSVLAADPHLKHLANRATCLYISSLVKIRRIHIDQSKLERFAESMGLSQLPEDALTMNAANIAAADDAGEEGMNGGEKKRKMSPLERLKEKIKAKKMDKKKTPQEADNGWEEMANDLAEAMGEKKKKISKFERRERRLDELRAVPQNDDQEDTEESLFTVKIDAAVPVPKYTPAELKALSALKKQKLRLRSDGTFNVRGAGGLGAGPEKIVFRDEEEE